MPTYRVTAPDGRTVRLTGDQPPTEAQLTEIFSQLGAQETPAEDISTLESIGRGALEGATLGFADEAYGAARALFGDKTYEEYRDIFREGQAEAREANPWAFGGAELAGGFLLPGGAAAKAAGTATRLLPKAAKAAGIGAGFGGVAGAGYSEAETGEEVLGDVARGAATGAALGGVIPVAGRGVQRLRHRYAPEQRALRNIEALIPERNNAVARQQLKKIMDENPSVVLADLTPEGRSFVAQAAVKDDALFNQLLERQRTVADNILEKIPGVPALEGTAISAAQQATPRPLTTLKSLYARHVADADNKVQGIWKNAQKVARRELGHGYQAGGSSRRNKAYVNSVIQNFQSELNNRAGAGKKGLKSTRQEKYSYAQARARFLDDVREINPAYVDALEEYGNQAQRVRAADKAYNWVKRGLSKKDVSDFVEELQMRAGRETQENLNTLFGGNQQAIEQFSQGLQVHRALLQAYRQAAKAKADPGVLQDFNKAATDIRQAVDNLAKSATADRILGVDQKLGTAAALRRLLMTVSEHVPLLQRFVRGGGRDEAMLRVLRGRELPEYAAALPKALSARQARTAAVAGLVGGQ